MPIGETGSFSRIAAIASNAFREAVRDRILYNLIIFVLLLSASAIFLGELTAGQEARVITNLGLSAILMFGTFISIFVGVSLVWKEIEKRTVYSIFSKPVRRQEFIIGKYLGLCLTILVNVALMGLGVSIALLYVGDRSGALTVWPAILLIFLQLTMVIAVAITFSSFSTPALSAMLTFLIFVIGHFSTSLKELGAGAGFVVSRIVLDGIYYILPNFSQLTFITETSNGMRPTGQMLGFAAIYAVIYNLVLLAVAVTVFSRRNFK